MGPTANAGIKRCHRPAPRTSSWPFRAPQPPDRVLVTEQGVGVPAHQEIEFKDGSRIWLNRVTLNGAPDLFVRELGEPAAGVRIDLRELLPECVKELPTTSTRDVAGYIWFSLRGRFATRQAFIETATRMRRPD
jgi:hypothetical protein